MNRQVAVLVNPTAGRGKQKATVTKALEALRANGRPVNVLDASTEEQARKLCAEAAPVSAALVAVGGDGTVNLAMQAVAGTPIPFGVVPAGTGNDFATCIGITAADAGSRIASALDEGRTMPVDLAKITGTDGYERWYGAVLAAGFDALVNERANGMSWPRGPRRYDIAILAELAKLRPRHYTLTLDGRIEEIDAILVAVGNTASYGGGMKMCPAADPTDDLLDIVTAGPISRTTLVRLQPKLYDGSHVLDSRVRSIRAHQVTIEVDTPITAYADGERTTRLPITIESHPHVLQVLA